MISFDDSTYAWLAVVVLIVTLRFASRIIQVGSIKNLQLEDVLMALVLVCYCMLTVGLLVVERLGTNEIPLNVPLSSIDPATIPDLVLGSKWVIITEQMWLATIWGCKACLLLLYSNMTTGLPYQSRLVLIIGAFCAVSYLVIEICFFGVWCRPFYDYWSVPPTTIQCSVYTNHLILVLALNVTSDLVMMCIPLPILIQARLSLIKKLTLCAVFSLGIFVIICCVMSKYYSISKPYGIEWINWYVREAGTAVIVANIPQVWPLMRRLFNARSFLSAGTLTRSRKATGEYGLSSSVHLSKLRTDRSQLTSALDRSDSQEYMKPEPLQIWEQRQFEVVEETEMTGQMESHRRSPSLEYPGRAEDKHHTTTVVTSHH